MTKSSPAEKRMNAAGSRKTAAKRNSPKQAGAQKSKAGKERLYDEFFDEQAAIAIKKKSSMKRAAAEEKVAEGKGPARSKPIAKQSKSSNRKRSKNQRKRGPLARLMRWFIAAACLVLCWCLFAYYMIVFNEQQPLVKADAGIILGAALWNDQPSPALKERLDYAIELYEEDYIDYLILSGGKPENRRGLTEAEGMKAYLLEAGIPEDKLLLEGQSRDTYENLMYSKRVADANGLQSIMIITHHYHTKRAEDVARYVDFQHVQTAGFDTQVLNESYHYTREMLAYTKWQLNKLFIPLGIMI